MTPPPPIRFPARVIATLLLILASFSTSISRADVPGTPPSDDAAILPYLDDGTFLVARLDVDRVDQDALVKFMDDGTRSMFTIAGIPADQRPMVEQQVKQSAEQTKQWLTDMAAAGGKRVYFLFSSTDIGDGGRNNDDEPLIVVPVAGGADAAKIAEVLQRGPGKPADVSEIGKAVIVASAEKRERVEKTLAAPAAPRPELAEAFAAAGKNSPLRIALIPTESSRTWFEGNLPKLPEVLGGENMGTLVRSFRWACIAAEQKPTTVAKITLKGEDAEKAKTLMPLLTKIATILNLVKPPAPEGEDAPKDAVATVQATEPKLEADNTIKMTINPLAVQMAIMSAQMQGRGAPAAQPTQPDTGGL